MESSGDAEDLPELVYWQNHGLVWGQDNAAAKVGVAWWWTPLMDGSLVQASWLLPCDAKLPKVFAEGLATYLAPQFKGVPYEWVSRPNRWTKYARGVRRKLPWRFGPSQHSAFRAGPNRRAQREWLLFERTPRVWPHLIGAERVWSALDASVNTALLWNIATLELFDEAHLEGSKPTKPDDGRGVVRKGPDRQPGNQVREPG